MGNGNLCLQYLQDLFSVVKNFYHPSNTGKFQKNLVKFILELTEQFVDRVHLWVHVLCISFSHVCFRERKACVVWAFAPHESYRLTEQNITDFVSCVREYAFISIFNKDYMEDAAEACQYLSMLRPELIVPPMIEKSDVFFVALVH